MKIVFLSRYQNQINRGAENFVLELSKRLSKNHRVDILSGKSADDVSKIVSGGYDVVIPINGRLQSLRVSLGRITGQYKLLITGHSGIGRDDIWNIAVCKPDVFVALTDYMARWASKWAWGSKVVKIPDGIDLNRFSPTGPKIDVNLPRPIILSVGALVWYKHHEKVIRVIGEMGYGSLVIVGKGPEKNSLEKLGNQVLKDRFRIVDFNYENMPKVYRSADLFTLPSWDREAFGLVYLEAMAAGVGVVAPDDSSRREIVGKGGLFTDADDPSAYGAAVKKALRIDWKKLARAQAEKFSWEKVAGEYEKAMFDMIKL